MNDYNMNFFNILKSLEKTGCIVCAEEHNTIGGLGESIASLIVRNKLVPMEFVGVNDQFGESGKPSDLMKKYGLSTESIIEAEIILSLFCNLIPLTPIEVRKGMEVS